MQAFDAVADRYAGAAVVQRAAAARLFDLLAIRDGEDVLDLGCGPGHLTRTIAELTTGEVLGVDSSPAMVAEARRAAPGGRPGFAVGAAEALGLGDRFDAIFCNSAFQWFGDPQRALASCHRALRPGGRIAIQAPAGHDYCPKFLRAVACLLRDERTAPTFRTFRPPWCFLPDAAAYAALALRAGLDVDTCRMERVVEAQAPATLWRVFASGAAAGYLDPARYGASWPGGYAEAARELILRDFHDQAGADGTVAVVFHRLYLLAHKP